MKTTTLLTLLCLAVALNAQKNDYIWYMGFGEKPLVKDTVYNDCTQIEKRSTDDNGDLLADDINISIAPNPAISEVSVYSNAEIESLDIYTVTGEVIHSAEINNRAVTIDIAEYTSGMYFISLHMLNGSVEVRKLLVH